MSRQKFSDTSIRRGRMRTWNMSSEKNSDKDSHQIEQAHQRRVSFHQKEMDLCNNPFHDKKSDGDEPFPPLADSIRDSALFKFDRDLNLDFENIAQHLKSTDTLMKKLDQPQPKQQQQRKSFSDSTASPNSNSNSNSNSDSKSNESTPRSTPCTSPTSQSRTIPIPVSLSLNCDRDSSSDNDNDRDSDRDSNSNSDSDSDSDSDNEVKNNNNKVRRRQRRSFDPNSRRAKQSSMTAEEAEQEMMKELGSSPLAEGEINSINGLSLEQLLSKRRMKKKCNQARLPPTPYNEEGGSPTSPFLDRQK